jgi:predicted DNA-binding protein (MmcQ/YjbR family)
MKLGEWKEYIAGTYGVEPDFPWARFPDYMVFRHGQNRKWFALLMSIPGSKLRIPGDQTVDILNLKCDSLLIGSLCGEPGFYPAYHMNKETWVTAALDGSAEEERIKQLLHMSFHLTAPKNGHSYGSIP